MEITANITKVVDDQRRFFGFAYVVSKDGEQITDLSGDIIDTVEARQALENAVYKYVLHSRAGDHDHREFEAADLIECMVLTKDKADLMGIDTPVEGVWIGFQARDDEAGERLWKAVKDGKGALSIVGIGTKVPV